MNEPLVTIICLCYNHEKYVQDCIESIINQTYSNIELIIIDNDSEDDSVKIIDDYNSLCSKRFSNYIFFKNNENLGITKALNNALKIAKGEYISYIAADDIYVADKIEIQLKSVTNLDSSYQVICGNVDFIDEDNKKIYLDSNGQICYEGNYGYENANVYILRNRDSKEMMDHYGQYQTLLQSNYIQASTVLIRKSILEDVGLFDESFLYEDWPLWLKISRKYKFHYIDKIFLHYRKHPTAITYTYRNKLVVEDIKIILREKEFCYKHNLKHEWSEKYAGILYTILRQHKIFIFCFFIIKAKSIRIVIYFFKKIIMKLLCIKK